ncbi:hypothetical protein [Pseudoalteromonas luteoviolacea]|uniref:Uncharacterized protein n=1 Tax=Pseudoalteromonas luteoviolacea S4054 TaxID=1129367 RepID=A0A0F6AAP3_9GAMM|nr:hypothetical protein [Pseudoalteromonas luteoviolacea]AOT09052.1 hypothetical protein S4054249_14845 [Pseudoalteromonas luteoviolacea]AOT13964.1 hypothetical protein S40542_14815 [Pseudoalteromonas luteoviolacea]AOT18879.1 hypothetical protein S4054_14820 [Pseudoalteromonas luteoviolacea]KKE83282.1 hypothetical protein N479_14895 [Pseudoalteromonas luteoviolacea S4054]KZN73225.1 hypothetical protein N481_12935 [Pseudoalteromonas luteoviolacea S4047-1]
MPFLIVILLIHCLVICFILAAIINGHNLNRFEEKIRGVFIKPKVGEGVPDALYDEAYEIVMDLGKALEIDNDTTKHDAVQMALKRVEGFRDDSKDYQIKSKEHEQEKGKLKVVK